MKKLVCVFCSFFMGLGLIFADDGILVGNQPKSSKARKELDLVKQSKGILIRVPVENGVERPNLAQMRLVNYELNTNVKDVDSAWKNGAPTSYRPFISEEEIAAAEANENDSSIDQMGFFHRRCCRAWRGVYYYSTPVYTPVVWRPTYYTPTYYVTNDVYYSYSYTYTWSTPYYRTYYYARPCCW